MKLGEFLAQHPAVKLATSKNNSALLQFFENSPMKGEDIELAYHRAPDFFSFLRFHSDRSFVFYISEPLTGEIEAVGTLVLRPGTVEGKKTMVGYFGDLRVTHIRKWGRIWRNFYDELVSVAAQIEEFQGAQYFLTAMLDDNPMAHQALTAEKQRGKKLKTDYHFIQAYSMVNVIAPTLPVPFQAHPLVEVQEWNILNLSEENLLLIKNFLKEQTHDRDFAFENENLEEFRRRLSLWKPKLLVALENSTTSKRLVGITSLWSPSPDKKIIIRRLSSVMKWVRRIPGMGKVIPAEGDELKVGYLAGLELDRGYTRERRAQVLISFLQYIFKNGLAKNYHSIAFADFEANRYREFLKWWWTMTKSLRLFQVVATDGHRLSSKHVPDFEMSLV